MTEPRTLTPDALLEAMLFTSPQPVTLTDMANAADLSEEEAQAALDTLKERLQDRGLRIQEHRGAYQLVSAPEAAPHIETLLGLEVNLRLSQAALETLAIVAYAQPVTRPQVEAIRGVNSDGVMRTLLAAGLIEDVGRAESVGRPILYSTTLSFLQQFGLEKAEDLPPLEKPTAAQEQDIQETTQEA